MFYPPGFQSFLRRNDFDYGDYDASDADWSSFYFPTCEGEIECSERRALHINCLPREILIHIFSYLSARAISKSVLPVSC